MPEPRVAVFTITKDRLEYTRRMIRSLQATARGGIDHYFIDNGSQDGTVGFLRASDWPAGVVLNPDNRGISIAWNQALDLIGDGYDYIVKLDNDCEAITSDWLGSAMRVIEQLDRRAVVSPYVEGLREHRGGVPRHSYRTVGGLTLGVTRLLGGISLVAPASAYADLRLPEGLPLRGNQDHWLSAAFGRRGYLLGYVEEVRVRHMDTTQGQHERYPEYFAAARRERWTVYGRPYLLTLPALKLYCKLTRLAEAKGRL